MYFPQDEEFIFHIKITEMAGTTNQSRAYYTKYLATYICQGS